MFVYADHELHTNASKCSSCRCCLQFVAIAYSSALASSLDTTVDAKQWVYALDKFGWDFGWYNESEWVVALAMLAGVHVAYIASATFRRYSPSHRWLNNSSLGYSIAIQLNSIRWNEMAFAEWKVASLISFSYLSVSPSDFCAYCTRTLAAIAM